jgi:hypothetical protein
MKKNVDDLTIGIEYETIFESENNSNLINDLCDTNMLHIFEDFAVKKDKDYYSEIMELCLSVKGTGLDKASAFLLSNGGRIDSSSRHIGTHFHIFDQELYDKFVPSAGIDLVCWNMMIRKIKDTPLYWDRREIGRLISSHHFLGRINMNSRYMLDRIRSRSGFSHLPYRERQVGPRYSVVNKSKPRGDKPGSIEIRNIPNKFMIYYPEKAKAFLDSFYRYLHRIDYTKERTRNFSRYKETIQHYKNIEMPAGDRKKLIFSAENIFQKKYDQQDKKFTKKKLEPIAENTSTTESSHDSILIAENTSTTESSHDSILISGRYVLSAFMNSLFNYYYTNTLENTFLEIIEIKRTLCESNEKQYNANVLFLLDKLLEDDSLEETFSKMIELFHSLAHILYYSKNSDSFSENNTITLRKRDLFLEVIKANNSRQVVDSIGTETSRPMSKKNRDYWSFALPLISKNVFQLGDITKKVLSRNGTEADFHSLLEIKKVFYILSKQSELSLNTSAAKKTLSVLNSALPITFSREKLSFLCNLYNHNTDSEKLKFVKLLAVSRFFFIGENIQESYNVPSEINIENQSSVAGYNLTSSEAASSDDYPF